MSSSQSLTLIELHGFRALLALIGWITCRSAQLLRGLQLLANSYLSRLLDRSPLWLRPASAEVECSPWGPVLWFDIVGRRDGPQANFASHRQRRPIFGPPGFPAYAAANRSPQSRRLCRPT
jgi:hypothetical protein